MTNKSFRDYINLIEAAQQENLSEDGVESWAGNPSDRRHPGHESYMTPEYMLAHYKKRLAQIAAGKHKYPKEVAQLQAKIAKLEKQGVAEDSIGMEKLKQDRKAKEEWIKNNPLMKGKNPVEQQAAWAIYSTFHKPNADKKQGAPDEQLEETSPEAIAKINQLTRR